MLMLLNFLLLFFSDIFIQKDSSQIVNKLKKDITFLASDELEGRLPSSKGEKLAMNFLDSNFKKMKLVPLKGKDSFFWNFVFEDNQKMIHSSNIVATTGNQHKNKIFITAHFDHLGFGNQYSLEAGKKVIHNGADDNASGVALLLALAKKLADNKKKLPYDVIFIAFSGHETGLHGAKNFEKNYFPTDDSIIWAINLDMVGRLDDVSNRLIFRHSKAMNDKLHCIKQTNAQLNIWLKDEDITLDNFIFEKRNILSGTFSTGIHDDYHKSSDDVDKINFTGIYKIYLFLIDFIFSCAQN